MRAGKFEQAIQHYLAALAAMPGLTNAIAPNLSSARQKYRASRNSAAKPRVAVCGWELSHNAAGRVYTLAMLYETFAEVEIIGCHFPALGREIWEPIRDTSIAIHSFVVEDEAKFIDQAIALVAAHPCDIVHLSKPRAPNIIFGILYKLIWDAKVLMDIDDEELAFVGADTPISVDNYIQQHGKLPDLKDLAGKDWTRLAVGLSKEFDGITVCNTPLQQRYGGEIIRHARDEKLFKPSPELKRKSREKYGIPLDKKVVLFFGTPLEHKGLVETAQAIADTNRSDIIFCIVGDFADSNFKKKLQAIKGCGFLFLPSQPFKLVPEIVLSADCCVLIQNEKTLVGQYQTPAKLTDALAASLAVIVNRCPSMSDFIAAQVVIPINENLGKTITRVLFDKNNIQISQIEIDEFYASNMTLDVNGNKLHQFFIDRKPFVNEIGNILYKVASEISKHHYWVLDALALSNIRGFYSKLEKSTPIRNNETISVPPQLKVEKNVVPAVLVAPKKLPITVLIITWDVGHNPLGRSYLLAEVVQRIARHSLLVGFQFPRYGDAIWEPVRDGQLPVITLPGSNLPEFYESLQNIASRIKPDVVIACKARLPSVALGMMIKEKWGCPLIVDVDDHELSFFKDQTELSLDDLAAMTRGAHSKDLEPYAELWTRLTQSLCKSADEIIVSNVALQKEFGGTIVPHVRDENTFDPTKYNKADIRRSYGVPLDAKIVLFFGTPRAHKGVDVLARAVNQITDPNFRLLVVGTAPDRSVTAKLDLLAPGRVIYLPNQPFAAIPEILAMADVVCLPQDEGHAISKFQLPAKAIDAVAMGIPLLVTNTPPLMQLVDDQVAELVTTEDIPAALERLGGDPQRVKQWQVQVRSRFLARYSYAAAMVQMRELFQRCLAHKSSTGGPSIKELIAISRHVLGLPVATAPMPLQSGIDIVVFWKQNDTGLYGRRHDMVIKYLASRSDVRKVLVFDAPMSEFDLVQRQQNAVGVSQHRWIYVGTCEKVLGIQDSGKISYNVFVYPPGKYQDEYSDVQKPSLTDAYIPYVNDVLRRECVNPKESIFWIYPKNYSAPALIQHFQPGKVVVDVVDDHRAWPGVSDLEKQRLTNNYCDILACAHIAFTNCTPMVEAMKDFYPNIRLVPNGCDVQPLDAKAIDERLLSPSAKRRKTIVFVGNLETKIDIPLLEKLAERYTDCDIVLIGSTHANPLVLELSRFSNIHFKGVVPYREIGGWLSRADVGIMPHLDSNLTQNMNPLKLYVYLSWYVPVVSTNICNIDTSNGYVKVAQNHDQFLELVGDALENKRLDREVVQTFIQANNWRTRFEPHIDELHQSIFTSECKNAG